MLRKIKLDLKKTLFFGIAFLLAWYAIESLFQSIFQAALSSPYNFDSYKKGIGYFVGWMGVLEGLYNVALVAAIALLLYVAFKRKLEFLDRMPKKLPNIMLFVIGGMIALFGGFGSAVFYSLFTLKEALAISIILGLFRMAVGAALIFLGLMLEIDCGEADAAPFVEEEDDEEIEE